MYICIYTYIYTCIYAHVHIYIHTCVCINLYICVCVYKYVSNLWINVAAIVMHQGSRSPNWEGGKNGEGSIGSGNVVVDAPKLTEPRFSTLSADSLRGQTLSQRTKHNRERHAENTHDDTMPQSILHFFKVDQDSEDEDGTQVPENELRLFGLSKFVSECICLRVYAFLYTYFYHVFRHLVYHNFIQIGV